MKFLYLYKVEEILGFRASVFNLSGKKMRETDKEGSCFTKKYGAADFKKGERCL